MYDNSIPELDSYIRFFHASANAPSVDIYINGSLIISNLNFSEISSYKKLTPGKYNFEIYKHGSYDSPILKQDIDVLPYLIITVCAILSNDNLELFSLRDQFTTKSTPNSAHIRFINFSPDSPLLSLELPNEDILFNQVEYLENTNYYSLSPALYDFMLTQNMNSSYKKFINNIDLDSNTFYTIYIIGLFEDYPELGYLLTLDGLYDINKQ
ncbi:MAG: DUF4397 domain-containing protein [Clostridium sp.]|nr:DUF4397 domain-containing protein [Clostridium sp.]MDY3827790.1 DUF4397 domain-containing protein [Clostridium sp.]